MSMRSRENIFMASLFIDAKSLILSPAELAHHPKGLSEGVHRSFHIHHGAGAAGFQDDTRIDHRPHILQDVYDTIIAIALQNLRVRGDKLLERR